MTANGEAAPAPRIFASVEAPADPHALASLVRGIRGADLAAPPVVLPDFLHKRSMEMPSSIAIATRDSIHPSFTASSLNCGMALIALDADDASDHAVLTFLESVRARHPWPAGMGRSLTTSEVMSAAVDGARFALHRFSLEGDPLDRMEEGGRISLDRYGGRDSIRREIPWLTRVLSGMRFGSIGPSNHFIEVQRVEQIVDAVAARRLGVAEGQITVQYHGGGGVLAGQVGRLYASRTKSPRSVRAIMSVQKPAHHLATAKSVAQARERIELYFRRNASIPLRSEEGRRVMLAHAAAMNFGFAFRLAVYASLSRVARAALGARDARLVVDSPHNSIYEEDGAVVHRHNSCRAWPSERYSPAATFSGTGQALLLPGTSRTSSYLCVAGPEPWHSLYSASHGSGGIIDEFVARGRSARDPQGRRTLRLRYDANGPQPVPQLDDRGVNEALAILERNGIARAVARMRPLGVLN